MTRIAWGATGARRFETGVDRGVLYVGDAPGVPWNGLKSVAEQASGGEARPYYIDGYKYLNLAGAEDFAATISAYGAPREFMPCDGSVRLHHGLFVTQQTRIPFGFSYRTLVGNDRLAENFGYKIHLVYNALAQPSAKNNQSASGTPTPLELSWSITTQPPKLTGYRPTAHFVIDSTMTPPALMQRIEDILYGSEGIDARLPTLDELISIFAEPGPIIGRNLAINPNSIGGAGFSPTTGQSSISQVDDWIRFTFETSGGIGVNVPMGVSFVSGTRYRVLIEARANRPLRARQRVKQSTSGPLVNITTDALFFDALITGGPGSDWQTGFNMDTAIPYVAGDYVEIRRVLYSVPEYTGPFFSGDTPNDDFNTYEWEGAPNASSSIVRSWY